MTASQVAIHEVSRLTPVYNLDVVTLTCCATVISVRVAEMVGSDPCLQCRYTDMYDWWHHVIANVIQS